MGAAWQTKTLAVRGHYPLTRAASCDAGDSTAATQDLFVCGRLASLNQPNFPCFCGNTICHCYKNAPAGEVLYDIHSTHRENAEKQYT